MILTAQHLPYPRHLEGADVAARIRACLAQSDEALLKDSRCDWENFIMRECKEKDVHPMWPLITLQKEQGLLSNDGKVASQSAWDHAAGVVGQHTVGSAIPTADGLASQLKLCIRLYAWHGGTRAVDGAFGLERTDRPPMARWSGKPMPVELLGLRKGANGKEEAYRMRTIICNDAAEYAMWIFTPNGQENVPAMNADVAEKRVLPFFQ